MKKGQKIKMYFKCAGMVSNEGVRVKEFTDTTVTITDSWHSDKSGQEENGLFDRKTGKCLNDYTAMGASRYIDPV
jgi:hypothetical protein